MKMPDSSCFGDYEESGTDVQALWQGEPCNFSVQMYLDDESPITGGREIWGFPKKYARALAAEGVNVLINGFGKPEDIEKERAAIESEFNVKAVYSPADMTKPDEIEGMIGQAVRDLGGIDILINNAGVQFVSPIEEFPIEKWNQIIAINLSAAFHGMWAAIPVMKKAGWGRIISAHSLVASPFKAAYVAAKHGIAGLTETAALELATHKITVNCISPGYVWTRSSSTRSPTR